MKQETNIYKEKFKINLFGKEVGGNLMLFCTENLLMLAYLFLQNLVNMIL